MKTTCESSMIKGIFFLMGLVLFMGGCSGRLSDKQRARLSCISIDPNVVIKEEFKYSGKKQAYAIYCGGLIGWVASDALGIEREQKKQIVDAMQKNKIDIRQIMVSEFEKELAQKSDFPPLVVKGGDAIFHFKTSYSLNTYIYPSKLFPLVNVWVSLVDKNGKTIWKRYEAKFYIGTAGYTHEQYIENPELLREVFQETCGIVAKKLTKRL